MALATDKLLFLHIPKTAGVWIRQAFKALNIHHYEIGHWHSHFPYNSTTTRLYEYKPIEFYKDKFIFTFVRHPLSWYQSRWAFRMKQGWRASHHPLDFHCASNDFCRFVENALAYRPSGWVTEEYMNFIATPPKRLDFIGRTENLIDDFIMALNLAGDSVDEKILRSMPRVNDSDMDGYSSKHWARYTRDLADRVMNVESVIINRFYNDYNIEWTDFID